MHQKPSHSNDNFPTFDHAFGQNREQIAAHSSFASLRFDKWLKVALPAVATVSIPLAIALIAELDDATTTSLIIGGLIAGTTVAVVGTITGVRDSNSNLNTQAQAKTTAEFQDMGLLPTRAVPATFVPPLPAAPPLDLRSPYFSPAPPRR